jgi:hypothetical protein
VPDPKPAAALRLKVHGCGRGASRDLAIQHHSGDAERGARGAGFQQSAA